MGAYWGRGWCLRGLWGMYSVSVRVHTGCMGGGGFLMGSVRVH